MDRSIQFHERLIYEDSKLNDGWWVATSRTRYAWADCFVNQTASLLQLEKSIPKEVNGMLVNKSQITTGVTTA
jgi:hypothetical protein